MIKIIIEELLENANEHMKYKNTSYCKGQINAYKKILEILDEDNENMKIESKII